MSNNTNITYEEAIIVVGTNGLVWVCERAEMDDNFLHMVRAKIIRNWGTTKGLNELVRGPTKNTVLDATAPVVSLTRIALIAIIPCDNDSWVKPLSVD